MGCSYAWGGGVGGGGAGRQACGPCGGAGWARRIEVRSRLMRARIRAGVCGELGRRRRLERNEYRYELGRDSCPSTRSPAPEAHNQLSSGVMRPTSALRRLPTELGPLYTTLHHHPTGNHKASNDGRPKGNPPRPLWPTRPNRTPPACPPTCPPPASPAHEARCHTCHPAHVPLVQADACRNVSASPVCRQRSPEWIHRLLSCTCTDCPEHMAACLPSRSAAPTSASTPPTPTTLGCQTKR